MPESEWEREPFCGFKDFDVINLMFYQKTDFVCLEMKIWRAFYPFSTRLPLMESIQRFNKFFLTSPNKMSCEMVQEFKQSFKIDDFLFALKWICTSLYKTTVRRKICYLSFDLIKITAHLTVCLWSDERNSCVFFQKKYKKRKTKKINSNVSRK